jgi:hypothetical protein
MFWQSVWQGLASLANWHVLVGMAGVSVVASLYPLIIRWTMVSGELNLRVMTGCLFTLIGAPLVQAIAVSGFVFVCLPAIIGSGGFTPVALIGPLLWPTLKAGFLAVLFVLVLCFIPLIGASIANTPGVPVFLQGIFMLKPITKELYYVATEGQKLPESAFPSFWDGLGYVLISLAFCSITLAIVTKIVNQVKKRHNSGGDLIAQYRIEPTGPMVLTSILCTLYGIIPLLMYGQHVALAIQRGG